jgi:hypothetical protein
MSMEWTVEDERLLGAVLRNHLSGALKVFGCVKLL